jgi:hypothetical protein
MFTKRYEYEGESAWDRAIHGSDKYSWSVTGKDIKPYDAYKNNCLAKLINK